MASCYVNAIKSIGIQKSGCLIALRFYVAFQELARGLYFRDVLERILGNQKKATGCKIQVKEIGRLLESAKIFPVPLLAPLLRLQNNAFFCQ